VDLGLDGALWAREGLIGMLVVTPFWASIETDMPLELWRRLAGDKVTLAAGLELLLRPYHAYRPLGYNTLETVRGAAASLLARGADRVYLFNYMDSQTAMPDLQNYPALLRECGALATLAGKRRRHVITYSDTDAPGEPQGAQLPRTLAANDWATFRIHVGPPLNSATLRIQMEAASLRSVRVNGEPCQARPVEEKFQCWQCPAPLSGLAVIDVQAGRGGTVHWVEIAGA
jgi:hypothetical protein